MVKEGDNGHGAGEKRRHPRVPVCSDILIVHPDLGSFTLKTRDLSQGGVFLVMEDASRLPVGTLVKGQVQDGMPDRPWVQMEVVRVVPSGVGLKFLD
ncbi:MAG TPA: PilZ domain-containing protein [Sedimenticola sp.]|nr:PilZ domain-containing protein [Sedimenticola sp.]